MEFYRAEVFIDEVHKRPAIWNTTCEAYANKRAKRQAWQELVEVFAQRKDSAEKKAVICVTLQRKWKSIRDAYARELRKRLNPSSSSGTQRGYLFFSRLSFLEGCVEVKEMWPKAENEDKETDASVVRAEETPSVPKKRKKRVSQIEERPADVIETNNLSREVIEEDSVNMDEDKMFCLSLYKELGKVPENQRLATKIKLLKVIQKAQYVRMLPQQVPPEAYWPNKQNTFSTGCNSANATDSRAKTSSIPVPPPASSVISVDSDTE